MTVRVFWLLRVSGFALLALTAVAGPPRSADQRAVQIACFSAVGVALVAWCAVEVFPRHRARILPAAFAVIAASGGVAAATSGNGQTLIAFACTATGWAGSDTDRRTTAAIAAAAIVPLWIAGAFTHSNLGTMVGYPALIAVCGLFGLNRRSYRVQAEQAAALLVERERLQAEQRRADVLDERARIAREIHDVLAHSLGALGIQIQMAKAMLIDHGDTDRAVEALSAAQRMAADGLTETRRAVHALRVDSLPLGEELVIVTETHRKRYHVPVVLETSGTARVLPPDVALALLRAAQEAMVNAAKHAPGQRVAVRLDYGEDNVRLSVVNGLDGTGGPNEPGRLDGAGTTAKRPGVGGGYGLTGMRERLRLLNGTLLAGPREPAEREEPAGPAGKAAAAMEKEWAVTAEVPLAAAAGPAAASDTISR